MSTRIQTRAVAALLVALIASACGNAPDAPTPVPATASATVSATALLLVQVDKLCVGRESNIKVLVDFVQIGVTNPGDAGVSLMVTVGDHQLSAVSQRGTLWGPFPATVPAGGSLERLGCMPPDAI